MNGLNNKRFSLLILFGNKKKNNNNNNNNYDNNNDILRNIENNNNKEYDKNNNESEMLRYKSRSLGYTGRRKEDKSELKYKSKSWFMKKLNGYVNKGGHANDYGRGYAYSSGCEGGYDDDRRMNKSELCYKSSGEEEEEDNIWVKREEVRRNKDKKIKKFLNKFSKNKNNDNHRNSTPSLLAKTSRNNFSPNHFLQRKTLSSAILKNDIINNSPSNHFRSNHENKKKPSTTINMNQDAIRNVPVNSRTKSEEIKQRKQNLNPYHVSLSDIPATNQQLDTIITII